MKIGDVIRLATAEWRAISTQDKTSLKIKMQGNNFDEVNKDISLDKGKFMKEVRRLTHKTAALDDDNGGVVRPKKPLTAYMLFVREVN